MAISDGERALRITTIVAWVPGWGLLLPLGIVSHLEVPALGLIPMSMSALFGLYLINSKRETKRVYKILLDLFIAGFLLGMIIPGLIMLTTTYRWRRHAVFACFACMPLIFSFIMHAAFVLKEFKWVPSIEGWTSSSTCPHCSGEIAPWWKGAANDREKSNKKRYASVPVEEYTEGDAVPGPSTQSLPRPSTDDETARLV